MIIETNIKLHLRGENFSPRKLAELAGVSFTEVLQKGESRIPIGIHRGKLAHYGNAVLQTEVGKHSTETDYNQALYKLLHSFHDNAYLHIEESGVESLSLWIHFVFDREGSSGLGFSPDSMLLLGRMNIPMAINMSYYENYFPDTDSDAKPHP